MPAFQHSSYDTLKEIMTEYVFSGNISDETIRQHFSGYRFGLLKITKLTEETTKTFAYRNPVLPDFHMNHVKQ